MNRFYIFLVLRQNAAIKFYFLSDYFEHYTHVNQSKSVIIALLKP